VADLAFVDTHVHFSDLRDKDLAYVWLEPDFTHPVLGDIGAIQAQRYWADDFVRETRFDRLGCFRYSDEEGTAAFDLPNKVPRAVARDRHKRLLRLQQEILAEKLATLVGSEASVLVDATGPHSAQARLASQAPEIDGGVVLRGTCRTGELRRARITDVRGGVDLEAEVIA